ncbi:MAG: hypothetical protein U5N56_12760 [Candidatus Marinimicrobia bacterium]|nr:hypothetical protein [Candidatus Neomarinimicrobiota bacterium]
MLISHVTADRYNTILVFMGSVPVPFCIYRRMDRTSPSGYFFQRNIRFLIIAFRWIAILLLIFLLADMRIISKDRDLQKPRAAVIWDLSSSMARAGEKDFSVRDVLNSDFYRSLKRRSRLEHIADMTDPGIISEQDVRNLQPTGNITDCGRLLRFTEQQAKYQHAILISDGQSYLGEALENMKLKEDLTVHTIGVGDSEQAGVPVLESVHYPGYVTNDDSLSISWVLENPSLNTLQGNIFLKSGNDTLREEQITIQPQRMQDYECTLAPLDEGVRELKWHYVSDSISAGIGSREIRIHPSRIRVLCDADPPDQDIAMVSMILGAADRYEVYRRNDWERAYGNEKPDVLIQTWHPEQKPQYFEDVPAILFYRESGDNYHSLTELEIAVPRPYLHFDPDPVRNARYWTQLSPVHVPEYRGGGTIIMQSGSGLPFIIEDSRSRRFIINGAGLWRWQLAGYRKDWHGIYSHLIKNLIAEAIKRKGHGFVSFDRSDQTGRQFMPVNIGVRIYNRELLDASVTKLRISLYDTAFSVIRRNDRSLKGHITETLSHPDTGTYYLTAELFSGAKYMGSDTSTLHIKESDLEDLLSGCNARALQKLSLHHGGSYVHLKDIDSLSAMITLKKQWERTTRVFTARSSPLIYILIFLMLCADWILRKRYGGS